MTLVPQSRIHRAAAIAAGIALIVAPLIAIVIKLFSFGWLMVMLIMFIAPIPLMLIGYVLQLVLAIGALLRPNGVLRTAAGRSRAIAAAWVTSIGVLLTAFFFVDGGDVDWGSTFMYTFGMASDVSAGDVSTVLSFIAGAAWVLGWIWLVVEWIIAVQQRRRATV